MSEKNPKPKIERVYVGGFDPRWSISVGQYAAMTPCFALACCYAATGEIYRKWPEARMAV